MVRAVVTGSDGVDLIADAIVPAGAGPAGSAVTSEPGRVNIANVLTVVRIPWFRCSWPACSRADGWRLAALVAFCVASLTDLLDGRLAAAAGW